MFSVSDEGMPSRAASIVFSERGFTSCSSEGETTMGGVATASVVKSACVSTLRSSAADCAAVVEPKLEAVGVGAG